MAETPDRAASNRSARLLLVALLALGLVVRVALGYMMGERQAARLPESADYLAAGRAIAGGRGLVHSAPESGPAAPQMPGYPVLVAAAARFFSLPVKALLLFQAGCGAATLGVALWAAWRLAGVWAALLTVVLLAFDPYQVYFVALVTPVVPMGLALALAMAFGLEFLAAHAGGWRAWPWAALAGTALAAATYLDPWAARLVPLIGLAALVSKDRKRFLAGWAVAAAVMAILLAPWVLPHGLGAGSSAPVAELFSREARLWSPAPMLDEVGVPPLAGYTSLLPTAALALVGLWALRRRRAALVWLLAAPVALTLVRAVLPGAAHDRLAVMPALAVLGGAGLAAVLGRAGDGVAPASRAGEPKP